MTVWAVLSRARLVAGILRGMCLILIARDAHPDYALIVAANRDEFYDRPTSSAARWTDAPDVLGGRDLQAGGTWLGIDRAGRFAAVTNYRQGQREADAPRSRGLLVSEFLASRVATRAHVERVSSEADLYNGFNLIVGDPGELFYFSNRGSPAHSLAPGIYGLSNHLLDTPWPKVSATKGALKVLLTRESTELVPRLFDLVAYRRRAEDELLPRTGVSLEWERLLSAAFIVSDGYGTRSSTVVLVGRDGRIVFEERTFSEGGRPAGTVRSEFAGPTAVSTARSPKPS
jgi:uncharacterized protein with NRDE domain